ncbi:transposable element Tc1 transposase [Trichonephila clavipes]|nr:transposable element Tc1 transposase [Trichonephila clavipes]
MQDFMVVLQYESHSLIVSIEKRNYLLQRNTFQGQNHFGTLIFSDESKFNLYRSDRQYKVWRQVGKELDPKNTIKTVKYGGGSVLVWGFNVGLGSNFIFQQDNYPKHTAKIVKLYLLYHCKKELHILPQSPDLNVLENLWSQLKKSVHKHTITSKEDLKNVLKEEWTKITVETTKKLVESMPKRLQAVIKAKGFST